MPHRERRSPRADRSVLTRSLGVLAGAGLALAACGALLPPAQSGIGASDVGDGPGVTPSSVKMVFVGIDLAAISKLTGFVSADVGDLEAQVQALEDWVNANGGVGGRELDAVFRLYDAQTDSPASEEQLCNQMTQDDKAFAVVITGQFQTNARPCYAMRGTIVLDATLVASDRQDYEDLAPYLWTASYPEYDGFVRGFVDALQQQDFFKGRDRVGVIAADTPTNRRTMADLAVPIMKDLGVTPEVAWVDTTDQGTIFQGNDQGAVTFRSKGIDRVMFLGGARLASIFTTVAAAQSFEATYAISSFDSPAFFVNNPETIPPETLVGAVGIGFNPAGDVPDSALEFPASEAEEECLEIFGEAGITFDTREAARVALPYCDAARLLKAGADEVDGDLNAVTWSEAVADLGDGFSTATGFGGELTEDQHAAAGAYRLMAYDTECSCFVYKGDDVPFPAP